uniref:FYVE-type zinc finger domain-containing protein n=1 Tax=Anopheles funestus TaxID=62324 RepID=A0A4Y0BKN5_ANOFN
MLPGDLFLSGPGLPGSTMKLTPGVGMTLLIGIAGSIFLVTQSHRLLRSKLSQRRRSSRKPDAAECYMCNVNIELESTDSFATCRGCEKLVCRGENCCQWVESIGIWECTGCQSNRVIQQKAGEWLLNQLTARLKQPGPVELKEPNLLGLGLDTDDARSTTSSTVSANQRIKVREFIEELLSTMLHGPLDDVSVGQLMKHESYLPLWEGQQQHHSPSDQHFELKRLIQKILEEIAKLPELLNHSGLPLRPEEHLPYFDPKKYEQLLATAVLNKVVDDYRNPKNFTNSGDVAGNSSGAATPYGTVDINHNQLSEEGSHRVLLNKETLRQMSVTADDVHLHEGVSYTAPGERRLSDTDESYLSDYIQRHKVPLPDLSDTTGSGSGAEDDDLQSLKSNATDGTWEENWLFRKRQLKTTESSIAMLVPSPTEEVKALIGDKNADEISDLSEAGSDCEGYESDGNVNARTAPEQQRPAVIATSSKDTSEGISSSSKTQDSLEEHLPPDSLVSINSLPVNEDVLSEATNSQLLAEQSTQNQPNGHSTAGLQIDDLISMEPVAEKVETTNPALTNPFLDDVFEANNNVITDDVKLLQRTEAGDNRSSATESNGYGDRKEIPIDRAQKVPDHEQVTGNAEGRTGPTETEDPEASLDVSDTLIPGSIAEREHMKWRNAKPIANNPYSPDALQRRLSEKSRPTSMIEIDRLVRKEAAPAAGDTGVQMDDENPPKEPTDSGTENDRSLQSVTGGALAEKKKIGREYYINDPERLRAGGAPVKQTLGVQQQQHQQSHSTDDEKSLLLGRNVDDGVSMQQKLSPDASGNSLYRSSSFGKQRDPKAEDIFAARPIQVTADDPILKQGTKVSYLSTAAREIYLIPLEAEPNGSLISNSSELSSVNSPTSSTARPELDSLTYSEDSDVTRIYDLTTGEAKVVRTNQMETEPVHDTILQILPQSSSSPAKSLNTSHPVPAGINVSTLKSQLSTGERTDDRTQARRSPFPVKPLSPETIKFFAPKRKLSFTGSTNSLVSEAAKGCEQGTTQVLPSMHSSLHIDFPASRTATGSEFTIIEKDVIDVLPSVKELAKCYSGSTSDVSTLPPKPLYKPRDFIRQSSDVLNEEGMPSVDAKGQRQYSSTSSIAVRDEIREIRKLNLEAYRQSTYYPMAPGHSITARSLSKQIREHKANNVTDDHKVGQQEEPLPAGDGDMNGEGNSEGNGDDGHTSPERPGSPVLLPGHLKSSIEFFESLKNKS